jgi:preprotein translocase subunit YajC
LPQQRRQKKEKNFMKNLKKGDRIVSKSGLHGKVLELNDKDNTCVIETMAGKLKIERSAISLEASENLNASKKVIISRLGGIFFKTYVQTFNKTLSISL